MAYFALHPHGRSRQDGLVVACLVLGGAFGGAGCSGESFGAVCGNGHLDLQEVCDDGNTADGDGCSAGCQSDESCGNWIVDDAVGEECDDGNTLSGDGCQGTCALPTCGDGFVDPGERCDGLACTDDCSAVARSCTTIHDTNPALPDGAYTVDPDGMGPLAALDVYCDLTTDGGGWTLTYKVRSNIDEASNPWFDQVMPGSGALFPLDLSVPAMSSEGPTSADRAAYTTATGATEWRASTVNDDTDAIVFDIASTYAAIPGEGLRCFASGLCTSVANQGCSPALTDGRVIATSAEAGGSFVAGSTGYVCDIGWTACSFCVDWSELSTGSLGDCGGASVCYVGDSSIGRTNTTTFYYVR